MFAICDVMSRLPARSLLPSYRVTPKQMFFDCRSGEKFSAESADFAHPWIGIVLSVRGPGGAHLPRRLQATVVNQSQADAHTHGDDVEEGIEQAFDREQVSFG